MHGLLQIVVRLLQRVVGEATGRHVLGHRHEVADRTVLIDDRRGTVPDPQARAVRQHVSRLDRKAFTGANGLLEHVEQVRAILRIDQVLDVHLPQLRRRPLQHFAKSTIDDVEAAAGVGLGDAHRSLGEHGAQEHLLLTQPRLDAIAHRQFGTEREGKRRHPDQERDEQQERFMRIGRRKRTAASQRPPDGEAGDDEGRSRGAELAATQCRPQQRQHDQETEDAAVDGLLDERAEGGEADGAGRDECGACGQRAVAIERANVVVSPQHHHRCDDQDSCRIAQPPGGPQPEHARPIRLRGKAGAAGTDGCRDHRGRPETDQREFGDSRRGLERSATVRPALDEIAAEERRQRLAARENPRRPHRSGERDAGTIGRRSRNQAGREKRGPDPQSSQHHGGHRETSSRPDRNGAHMDRDQHAADLGQK